MTRTRNRLMFALLIATSLFASALAQAPLGGNSTTCVTPQGTCTVQAGPSGAPCACKTANGWVQGKLK